MTMRTHIDLIESLAVNHNELASAEVTGVIPFAEIAELFRSDDPMIFTLALRKILTNRTEQLDDFEILEIAKAFINFVGMTTEEGIRIAMRMGLITTAHKGGDETDDELGDDDFEAPRMGDEIIMPADLEDEIVDVKPIKPDTEEKPR